VTKHAKPDTIPTVHVETGAGVHPSSIDYVLDRLRSTCGPYPVASLDVRITHSTPSSVLVDASAVVPGRVVSVRAVARTPRRGVDDVSAQLATQLRTRFAMETHSEFPSAEQPAGVYR